MARSAAANVAEYLASLPPERREVVGAVRKEILANLPDGYVERMGWGMISYEIPLSTYPDTYNGKPLMVAALAAQKNGYSVYLMAAADPRVAKRLERAFAAAGRRLDMGRACVRFKDLDALPRGVVGEVVAAMPVKRYLAFYERFHPPQRRAGGRAGAGKKANRGGRT